jgi:prepilin-type N-terminal cleavage/methylation domain-containing protein
MTSPKRRARGFTLFELVIVLMVIAALVAVLLERLAYYHEALERAAMESTLKGIKTGLQVRLAELIIANREGEAGSLETQNPIQWLDDGRPANYAGAYNVPPEAGKWYFDAKEGQLVYVANAGERLEIDGQPGSREIRFRARLVRGPVQLPGGAVERTSGVTLAPVRSYRWL